jgi:hypothetical protein
MAPRKAGELAGSLVASSLVFILVFIVSLACLTLLGVHPLDAARSKIIFLRYARFYYDSNWIFF